MGHAETSDAIAMNPFYPPFRAIESAVNAVLFATGLIGLRRSRIDGPPKKVLIARYDMIGDFVLFTASLPLYRALFKEARLVLLVRDSVFEIARHAPYVDEVWKIPNKLFRFNPLERIKWFRRMRNFGFDLAISTVYSTSWVHLDCLVGWTYAPRRVAHECLDPKSPRAGKQLYFTELVTAQGAWKFTIDRDHDLLAYLGFKGKPNRRTEIHLGDPDRRRVEALIPQGRYAIVVPGARSAIRRWGADKFVEAIGRSESRMDVQWVLCGDRRERGLCESIRVELASRSIEAVNMAGRTSLVELCTLIEHAELFLGNETGPLHMAIALGIPAVGLTGGGMFGICFPYPDNPLAIPVTNRLPCYGCRWHCILDQPECITNIRAEDVVDAMARIRGPGGTHA